MWKTFVITCLGLPWLLHASAELQAAPPHYRGPEHFDADPKSLAEFVRQAEEFVAANPESRSAPRAVLDMLIVAKALQQQAVIPQLHERLLFRYPDSLWGIHAAGLFPSAADCAKFLKGVIEREPISVDRCQQLTAVMRTCQGVWRDDLLADEELLLEATLAAEISADVVLAGKYQERLLAIQKEPLRSVASAAFAPNTTPSQRFVALAQTAEHRVSRRFQTFYYSQLSEEERSRRPVLLIQAGNLLADRAFDEALPLIERLTESDAEPQLLFLKAWALAATGRTLPARDTVNALLADHPESAWAVPARQLNLALEELEATVDNHTATLLSVFETAREQDPVALHAQFDLRTEAGQRLTSSIGIDRRTDRLELLLRRNDQPVIGYRTDREMCEVVLAQEGVIHRFEQPGFIPVPKFTLARNPDGTYLFHFALRQGGQPGLPPAQSLLNSPILSTPEGVSGLVLHSIRKGLFPLPVVEANGSRLLRWVHFSPRDAGFSTVEIAISPSHRLTHIEADRMRIHNIQYGDSATVALAAIAWPELPRRTSAKINPTMIFQVMTSLSTLFTDDASTAEIVPRTASDATEAMPFGNVHSARRPAPARR